MEVSYLLFTSALLITVPTLGPVPACAATATATATTTATGTGTGRVADPNHAYHCKEKKLLALAESQLPNVFLASTCQGTRQQIRSCHAALPTPPWRRPRLEGAQCPACRDRCLPHHHPRRAARAEPPRCATRRAARALPPRQPPPSRAAQPPHVRGGAACNLKKTPPSDFFATFK